ncbi:MAG: FimV/HubP family polar landmark protein [Dokdonella sp.]|uniref:FimV/HubP family polar landmark protein n=1 Tax=Dokdonella sp. TaxID=2291710 RepID=UPI003F813D19
MKRPLQLSLAIALALGGTNALALGLGPVHVKSKLNQPLDAEIPVIQGTAGEAEGLLVSMAAAEDFERVGISRSHINVPLEFSVGKGANGQVVIRVTSKEPVQDSYLDFLVEANWPKGRLLREYTVLLDPPVTAPARSAPAAVAATPAPSVPAAAPRREKETVAAAERPAPVEKPAVAREKPAPVAPAPRTVLEGDYGPVKQGETLSGIARATRPDGGANLDQMMLALLKSNPDAFYKDNINALKRGAILRIPTADEAKAIGSASEAAAQVRAQFEDWRGGRATPTRVASTTEAPATPVSAAPKEAKPAKASTAGAETKSASERLELVPPKSGKGSLAMADQPGSGNGSAANAEAKRELARTKEALTARELEATELKSRVKELEDLKGKNDRLISLKDSEIADLQQKLRELQAKADAAGKVTGKPATPAASTPPPVAASATPPASTTPASTTPASTPASTAKDTAIDKKDIWGDAAKSSTPGDAAKADAHAGAAATPAAIPATTPPIGATPAPTPAGESPAATPSTAPGTAATPSGADASATSPSAAAHTDTAATSATPATTPSSTSTPANASGATVTPLAATPPTTATSGTTAKPTPATSVKKPTPAAKPQAAAWYDAAWVKPAALGAGVLLVLLGLFGMRKRKAAPAASNGSRPSIADAFGDSIDGSGATSAVMEAEATALRDQIAREPGNVGLYLELLSLYYAERDVAKFEDTAAEMHAYVTDPNQPEWQEAQAMGQELAPHNPLFAAADTYSGAAFADTAERPTLDDDDFGFAHAHVASAPAAEPESADDYGFGFAETPAPTHAHVPPPPAADAFTFDDLPPLEAPEAKAAPAPVVPAAKEPAPAMKEATLDDDFFAGEDAIGTKLDLAKAYMDMGDPDGARSMLEEVVAEGNDAQKAEAHRLISELR